MSLRISATEPTAPVASAARRSMSRGFTRPATWLLVAATTSVRTSRPTAYPIATASAAPASIERDRSDQVGPVAQHDTEHRAEDRNHQRRHDHGADHRGGRVGDDTRRRDHRGEGQQDPEAAELPTGLRPVEEHRIAHPLDVARGHARLVWHARIIARSVPPAAVLHQDRQRPRIRRSEFTQLTARTGSL